MEVTPPTVPVVGAQVGAQAERAPTACLAFGALADPIDARRVLALTSVASDVGWTHHMVTFAAVFRVRPHVEAGVGVVAILRIETSTESTGASGTLPAHTRLELGALPSAM
jgi:hypothetical protein